MGEFMTVYEGLTKLLCIYTPLKAMSKFKEFLASLENPEQYLYIVGINTALKREVKFSETDLALFESFYSSL